MANDGLSTEYENAVADVIAHIAGPNAEVERDAMIPGKDSGTERQLDIVVRGAMWGLTHALIVVDCKRWKKKIDVSHAQSFAGLAKDVGADIGIIVTTMGASEAARTALDSVGGLRNSIMSLEELNAWRPPGTRTTTYKVQSDKQNVALAAIRRAGFRAQLTNDLTTDDGFVPIEAFRHYPPGSGVPEEMSPTLVAALESVKVEPEVLSTGVISGGGTPRHRWLEVTADGHLTGYKILVADEDEVRSNMEPVKDYFERQGVNVTAINFDVERPDGWPFPSKAFG